MDKTLLTLSIGNAKWIAEVFRGIVEEGAEYNTIKISVEIVEAMENADYSEKHDNCVAWVNLTHLITIGEVFKDEAVNDGEWDKVFNAVEIVRATEQSIEYIKKCEN